MAFSHSQSPDARWSTFNDIQGNQTVQTNVNNLYNVHIHLNPRQGLELDNVLESLGDFTPSTSLLGSTAVVHVPPRTPSLPSNTSQRGGDIVGTTISLIPSIVQLLIGGRECPAYFRELKLELELLYQTLTLTGLAIQAYSTTPVSQALVNAIHPETERCHVLLQVLSTGLNAYWRALEPTNINRLWRQVCWSGWDGKELVSLQDQLSKHRKSLGQVLMALKSVAWMEHRNGLSSGATSLRQLLTSIKQSPSCLHHVEVDKVLVVDPLGRRLPVPTLFCSTWKNFDYIINGYCKDRIGNKFVARGDYQVIRASDSAILDISKFAEMVQPDMVLEMSIVLHRTTAFQDIKKKCPRCRHINSNVTEINGWIEWKVCRNCSGKFQVARITSSLGRMLGIHNGDSVKAGSDGVTDKRLRDKESEGDAKNDDGVREIVSPALQYERDSERKPAECDTGNDDGTHLFRRIHVVCQDISFVGQNTLHTDPGTGRGKRALADLTRFVSRCDPDAYAHGGFADLYTGSMDMELSQHLIAIKVLQLRTGSPEVESRILGRLCHEISFWQTLSHPNVLQVLGVTYDFGPYPSTISLWLQNGNAREYIQREGDRIGVTARLQLIKQVAAGLSYLHQRNVVHGDLSGTNVLIHDDGSACLCDFGIAVILAEFQEESSSDTLFRWAAPELVRQDGILLSRNTDVYSFGSTMLEILSGQVPYHYVKRNTQVYKRLRDGIKPRRPTKAIMTDEYWNFIHRCWDDEPSHRPTAYEALQQLQDFHHQSESLP